MYQLMSYAFSKCRQSVRSVRMLSVSPPPYVLKHNVRKDAVRSGVVAMMKIVEVSWYGYSLLAIVVLSSISPSAELICTCRCRVVGACPVLKAQFYCPPLKIQLQPNCTNYLFLSRVAVCFSGCSVMFQLFLLMFLLLFFRFKHSFVARGNVCDLLLAVFTHSDVPFRLLCPTQRQLHRELKYI